MGQGDRFETGYCSHTPCHPKRNSLGCQLDELPKQLGPWARHGAQTELRGHPVLQLIETAHEALQVGGGDISQVLWAQHIVNQLHLDGPENRSVYFRSSVQSLLPAVLPTALSSVPGGYC